MAAIKDKTAAVAAVWLWGPSLDVYAQGPGLSSQSFAKAQRAPSCAAAEPCYQTRCVYSLGKAGR